MGDEERSEKSFVPSLLIPPPSLSPKRVREWREEDEMDLDPSFASFIQSSPSRSLEWEDRGKRNGKIEMREEKGR